MNSTPNYGFNLNICGVDAIDQVIKRLEEKIDCKQSCCASKCEFEKHLTDPHAHEELFDKKADKKSPTKSILALADGFSDADDRVSTYWKNEMNEVTVHVSVSTDNALNPASVTIGFLPAGYRPNASAWTIGFASSDRSPNLAIITLMEIAASGEVRIAPQGAMPKGSEIYGTLTFLAEQ